MDLRLNELSLKPLLNNKYTAHVKILEFAKTAKAARDIGIKHIKSNYTTNEIKLTDAYSMHNWLFDKDFSVENRIFRDFLQSMITIPFIDEDREDEYLSNVYFFEDTHNGIARQECLGLAAAYLYDTLSISFQNGDTWMSNKLTLYIEKDDKSPVIVVVLNVYSRDCLLNEEISDRINQANNVQLIETTILPENKNIHFSDHHGRAELNHFWDKIKKNPYIVSARSTKWGGNQFIRRKYKNGMIEIVLINTDRRYALQVETTGRNYHETESIAKILEEQFV